MPPPAGETNLTTLLASMQPLLLPSTYVFLTFLPSSPVPSALPRTMTFAEAEGTTVVTTLAAAGAHAYSSPSRMITLQVHSSLAAVGFLARVTAALAARGVPTNAVSAFFHDHLFVPEERAEEAMEVLSGLVEGAKVEIGAA